jgi:hypothetical protein
VLETEEQRIGVADSGVMVSPNLLKIFNLFQKLEGYTHIHTHIDNTMVLFLQDPF